MLPRVLGVFLCTIYLHFAKGTCYPTSVQINQRVEDDDVLRSFYNAFRQFPQLCTLCLTIGKLKTCLYSVMIDYQFQFRTFKLPRHRLVALISRKAWRKWVQELSILMTRFSWIMKACRLFYTITSSKAKWTWWTWQSVSSPHCQHICLFNLFPDEITLFTVIIK